MEQVVAYSTTNRYMEVPLSPSCYTLIGTYISHDCVARLQYSHWYIDTYVTAGIRTYVHNVKCCFLDLLQPSKVDCTYGLVHDHGKNWLSAPSFVQIAQSNGPLCPFVPCSGYQCYVGK